DALAVEHAEQVVVGYQQQFGGIGEGRVAGPPGRIGMAVRRDDGQPADLGIQPPCDRALARVRWKQTVFVQGQRGARGVHGSVTVSIGVLWGRRIVMRMAVACGQATVRIQGRAVPSFGRGPMRSMRPGQAGLTSQRRPLSTGPSVPRGRGRVTTSTRSNTKPGSTSHSLSVLAPAATRWCDVATCTLSITARSQLRKSGSPGVGSRRMVTTCGDSSPIDTP